MMYCTYLMFPGYKDKRKTVSVNSESVMPILSIRMLIYKARVS